MKRALAIAAGWGLIAAIVWLSIIPSPPQVHASHSDKVGHLFAYGILMFWFGQLYATRRPYYALSFVALGVALEFVQGWLGYRTQDVLDMAANTVGVLLGWAIALVVSRTRTR